jgi:hypothetical protein
MVTDAQNETLIIDNFGVSHPSPEIADHSYISYDKEGGRTWVADRELAQMDTIRIIRNGQLAIHPSLKS